MYEDREETESNSSDKTREGSSWRWVALAYLSFMSFGSWFSYDCPGALQREMMLQFHWTSYKFSYLYSVYSWPNIVFCFFSGYLVDKIFGLKFGTIIYGTLVVIGQIIFSLGITSQIFPVILVGRFIFGIGAEAISICSNAYVMLWFKNCETNMVFAFIISVAGLGSASVYLLATPLESLLMSEFSQHQALIVSIIVCTCPSILCLLGAVLLGTLPPPPTSTISLKEDNQIKFTDILSLPLKFWLLCISCKIYIGCLFTFLVLSQNGLVTGYGVSVSTANYTTSMFTFANALMAPLLGYIVDKYGRNMTVIIISMISACVSHALLAFTMISPFIVLFLMAVSFALLLSSMWPTFVWCGENITVATTFGVVQAVMNICLSSMTLLGGYVDDKLHFKFLELFFFIILLVCLTMSSLAWMIDKKEGNMLNLTAKQRLNLKLLPSAEDSIIKE